jgi:hypothetical protein
MDQFIEIKFLFSTLKMLYLYSKVKAIPPKELAKASALFELKIEK